jgi:hypothetical protein
VQPFVAGYEARKYRIGSAWMPVVMPDASLWNWLANRVAVGPAQAREVILYIKH